MGCTEDHHVHNLLSDIVYNIKETMINYIDKNICDKDTLKFLEYIRSKIYKESNNILLLTVVESIGMHYQNEFPGYALDLISSIDIVEWDISRYATYLSNPQLEMLKKQIFQKVGIPGIKNRYSKDSKCNISIEQYAQNIQINGDSKIIEKCYKILDYLYSIVNNDEENASKRLEIKQLIKDLKKVNPFVEGNIFKSVENVNLKTIVAYKDDEGKHLFLEHYDD